MIRMVCLLMAVGLALPGLQAEIHKKGENVVGRTAHATAHAVTAAGQGMKAGAQKSGETVSGVAKAAVQGTATGTKAAGKGVVNGAKGVVHATGRGLEKTGGALAKTGQ